MHKGRLGSGVVRAVTLLGSDSASCSHPCASVGASGVMVDCRTGNFQVAGANLARALCKP